MEQSDRETESTRPLHVLFGSVHRPRTVRLHALRRRANRLDDTPQMHRRLAFMLLASARALRPLARTLRGGNTLRTASAVTTMSDTHSAASSTSEGRDRQVSTANARRHFDYLVIGAGSGGIASARRAATHGAERSVHRAHDAIAAITPSLRRRQGRRLREGCVRRHLRQRRLRPQKSHVQRGAHHGVRPRRAPLPVLRDG